MFESRISAGGLEKLPFSQKTRISSWSYDMEGHAKKCAERYCELANKTTQQFYKVSTPCIDDHHFKEEETKSVGELSQVCSHFFWNACTCHLLEDLILSGQWTNLHVRLYLTSITRVNINNIVLWIILQNNAGWDCFNTPILREILRTQYLLLVEHCAFLEVIHLFQQVGCARNKLPFHTVQQNPKSSLWTLDWD